MAPGAPALAEAAQLQTVVATSSTLSAEVDKERKKNWTSIMREMEKCFAVVVAGLQHQPVGVVGRQVSSLPFVNRIVQLVEAATALVDNQSMSKRGTCDQTLRVLVMCAQMWGIGKTRFAEVLHLCMQAWYDRVTAPTKPRRVIAYYRIGGILNMHPARLRCALGEAFVAMLQGACNRAGVDVGPLPTTYAVAVGKVSEALQKNDARQNGSLTTDLYIHFDEMDLHSDEAVKAFEELELSEGTDPVVKYHQVWRQFFEQLLMAPRIHLVVTGRVPQLALIATGWGSRPPTRGLHVVLQPLSAERLFDSLRLARLTNGALESSVSLVDVLFGAADEATTDAALRGLCAELDRVTGGVPRTVACFLTMLVRRVDIAGAPLLRDFKFTDRDVSDELDDDVTLSTIAMQAKRTLACCSKGSNAERARLMRELTQLARFVFSGAVATKLGDVVELITLADRYGCYLAEGITATARRVCIPLALRAILFGCGDVRAESLAGVLEPFASMRLTGDDDGPRFERQTMWAFRLHLALRRASLYASLSTFVPPSGAFASLLDASRATYNVNWSAPAAFVHVDDVVSSTGATETAVQWLGVRAEWLSGRTGVLLPPPRSRSCVAMCSLLLSGGKRRLLFFVCKHRTGDADDGHVDVELAKCSAIMHELRGEYESFAVVLACGPTPYAGKYEGRGRIGWAHELASPGAGGRDAAPPVYFETVPQAALCELLLGMGPVAPGLSRTRNMHGLLEQLDLLEFEAKLAAEAVTLSVLPLMSEANLIELGLPLGAVIALLRASATLKSAK